MARRDVVDIAWTGLKDTSVGEQGGLASRDDDADVARHTPFAADERLGELAADHEIGVTQVVTDGPEGDVTYHLQVGGDRVSFGSGAADPEDVRDALARYHTVARERIEAYGGTVEKFIGDAVMAVFGTPIAHGDDAERAVRAGLRVLEAVEELRDEGLALAAPAVREVLDTRS